MATNEKVRVVLQLDAETGQLKSSLAQIQGQLNKIQIPGIATTDFKSKVQDLQEKVQKLKDLTDEDITVHADLDRAQQSFDKLEKGAKSLISEIQKLKGETKSSKIRLLPDNEQQAIKKATSALRSYETQITSVQKKSVSFIRAEEKLNALREKSAELTTKIGKIDISDSVGTNLQALVDEAEEKQRAIEELYTKKKWKMSSTGKHYKNNDYGILDAQTATQTARQNLSDWQSAKQASEELAQVTVELQKQETAVQKLNQAWEDSKRIKSQDAFDSLKQTAKDLGIDISDIGDKLNQVDVDKLKTRLSSLEQEGIKSVDDALQKFLVSLGSVPKDLDELGNKIQDGQADWNAQSEAMERAARQAQDLANLKNQVLDFFSITGAIQLFRRSIESAFETVKELDEAMTEIAVVSDFSVNDMWDQLPKFTAQANELGMAIKDTYYATTLFVQQGLDLDNSMKLATETLKMAAVAGMDAAAATDSMTASLRGFGMAIDEVSAKRVNDVYSELAAISAADTQEISTAMSKVASLAHNVNMEFETTAAFLTQGIESTREAAEVIGTSLKTVAARFAEVKSLYSQGQITGTDENGEEIDVNRVQTALRSAGVSMTEFLKGNEGLDQVLLRLSERWDDLDILTQRYISTMAAGSRQQSSKILTSALRGHKTSKTTLL